MINLNKFSPSRRQILGAAGILTASSFIPTWYFSEKTEETVVDLNSGRWFEQWETVDLGNGKKVGVVGLKHEFETDQQEEKNLVLNDLKKICNPSSLIYIEEGALGRDKTMRTEGRGYFGDVAKFMLDLDKRVFIGEPGALSAIAAILYLIELTVPFAIIGTYLLSPNKKVNPIYLPFIATGVTELRDTLDMILRYYNIDGKTLSDQDVLRIAFSLTNLRDAQLALSITSLSKGDTWKEGQQMKVLRGALHGRGLTHYLKNPKEAKFIVDSHPFGKYIFNNDWNQIHEIMKDESLKLIPVKYE